MRPVRIPIVDVPRTADELCRSYSGFHYVPPPPEINANQDMSRSLAIPSEIKANIQKCLPAIHASLTCMTVLSETTGIFSEVLQLSLQEHDTLPVFY